MFIAWIKGSQAAWDEDLYMAWNYAPLSVFRILLCFCFDGGCSSHNIVLDKVRDLFCEYSLVAQSVASHVANKSENNQYGFGTWICFQTLDIPVEILLFLCTFPYVWWRNTGRTWCPVLQGDLLCEYQLYMRSVKWIIACWRCFWISWMCKVTCCNWQDVHDWKEPGADRLPLPEKAAKARAILARTNASTLHAHEHVRNGIQLPRDLVCWFIIHFLCKSIHSLRLYKKSQGGFSMSRILHKSKGFQIRDNQAIEVFPCI
jgi:hypothetical protein